GVDAARPYVGTAVPGVDGIAAGNRSGPDHAPWSRCRHADDLHGMVRDVLGAGESLMILALYLSPAAGWAGIEWTCFTTDRSPISNPAAPTARSADNEPAGESAASIVSTPIAFRRPQQGFDLLCDAPDKFGRDVLIPCRHGHLDHPMIFFTVRLGTPRTRSIVAAV